MTTTSAIPQAILRQLTCADPSWHPALTAGLSAMAQASPGYLEALAADTYLPTQDRLFTAFSQPLHAVRFVLVGEGPYPREDSATGVCFMDGAVKDLWSEKGLSKQVNRATSLRNFMKMLLVADGRIDASHTSGDALAPVAAEALSGNTLIRTGEQLQDKLHENGFLLLNASLVFRKTVAPVKDARAWQPFLATVLQALADHAEASRTTAPTLVLWGKIAEQLDKLPVTASFPQAAAEHPYNLSFIHHAGMQALFGPMYLLNTTVPASRQAPVQENVQKELFA